MNRAQRRARASIARVLAKDRPPALTPIPRDEWPDWHPSRVGAWISRDWIVQLYLEEPVQGVPVHRMSVNRAALQSGGRFVDGISWDELQVLKREIGYGDWYAVEIYPRDRDIVNVSNMRHLWMLERPLEIGWFNGARG
jgi:hypothetical protein